MDRIDETKFTQHVWTTRYLSDWRRLGYWLSDSISEFFDGNFGSKNRLLDTAMELREWTE